MWMTGGSASDPSDKAVLRHDNQRPGAFSPGYNVKMQIIKKIAYVVIAIVLAYAGVEFRDKPGEQSGISDAGISSDESRLLTAFENRSSDLQVKGQGVVTRLLRDDLEGSRHQKFIIEMNGGLSILVSHNIDLAPRINSLKTGDRIEFYGEYEWNPKGGVIHWTHHDPNGRHPAGWIKHNNKTYQ